MYVSNPNPRTGASGFDAEPDQLDRQGVRITSVGDEMRDQVDRGEVQPLMLGTAPPAQQFAATVAAIAGADGAPRALRAWADRLVRLGTNQRAAAADYRITDDQHAGIFNHLHP